MFLMIGFPGAANGDELRSACPCGGHERERGDARRRAGRVSRAGAGGDGSGCRAGAGAGAAGDDAWRKTAAGADFGREVSACRRPRNNAPGRDGDLARTGGAVGAISRRAHFEPGGSGAGGASGRALAGGGAGRAELLGGAALCGSGGIARSGRAPFIRPIPGVGAWGVLPGARRVRRRGARAAGRLRSRATQETAARQGL